MANKKFMLIDMLIFTGMALLSEWLGSKINKNLLYISFSQIFILLMIIRWEFFAVIPTVIIAVLRPVIFQAQSFNEMVIYSVPILILLLALVFVKLKLFKNINKSRLSALTYFTCFYLLFVFTNGLLILLLINQDYSFLNDFPKYILMLVIGNIIYYLFSGQKTMLVKIEKVEENEEKDRDNYDGN